MSAEIQSASGPGGNNGALQGTTMGGSKPLHRFIKGQPKIIGIIMLILGSSFFIVSVSITSHAGRHTWTVIPPSILMGVMFIICGILYILTEHNPTKKTVTISLALSIVAILGSFWTIMQILPDIIQSHYYRQYSPFDEDNSTETDEVWSSYYQAMELTVDWIFLFYTIVGGVIVIVMSSLGGAALRSTKTQAIVVMTTTPTETPAE